MFSLPSFKKALLALAAVCIIIGLSAFAVYPSKGFIGALAFGISLFAVTFIADLIVTQVASKTMTRFTLFAALWCFRW